MRAYRHPAQSQTAVLDTFEAAGWPDAIESPIRKDQLGQTLYQLNHKMRPRLIRFHANGTGDGILWEWRPPDIDK